LIVWPDRRSPYVPEIGVAQVKSLYEARSIFETQIAALAAQRITEEATVRLEELVAEQADFVERGLAYEAAEVDLLFHKGVAEATGNQFLVDASTRVNISALRIWYEMVVTEGMIAQEHADIADALGQHDVERSVAAVESHIANSYRRYIHMTTQLHIDPQAQRAAG
jgi:DNA-binding GntR family transcriptional regulator